MTQNKIDKIDKVPAEKTYGQPESSQNNNKEMVRVGDFPKKLVIGSGTSFKGSSIKTEDIEVYGRIEANIKSNNVYIGSAAEVYGSIICKRIDIQGKVNGSIDVSGKENIKKSSQVIGSLRYQVVSIEEGAAVYADLHCTKADQNLMDKISKLKKSIIDKDNVVGLNVFPGVENSIESENNTESNKDSELNLLDEKKKKKRSFFS